MIRCVCGDTTDEIEGRAYVCCDACSVWQHNICMGLPIEDDKLPEHYLCEQCQPEDHKPLLDAMARGEQPWEDRKRAHDEHLRQERNRKKAGKRKSKGGANKSSRASEVKPEAPPSEPSPAPVSAPTPAPPAPVAAPTPTPAPAPSAPEVAPVAPVAPTVESQEPAPTNNKRKHSEEQQPAEEKRRSSACNKRRKSEQQKEEKVDVETALVDIDQLPKERQNVAKRLASVLADGVREKVTAG